MRGSFHQDGGYFQVKTLILLVVEIYCYTTTPFIRGKQTIFFFSIFKATIATDSVRTRNHHLNISAEKGKPFLIRIIQ
jgi:hypothetical protein